MALNLKKCLSPVSLVLCDIYSQPTNAFALEKKKHTPTKGQKKNAWTRSTEEGTEIIFDELSVE